MKVIQIENDQSLRKFYKLIGWRNFEGKLIGLGAYKNSEMIGAIALMKCKKNKCLPAKYWLQIAVIEIEREKGIATQLYKSLFEFPIHEIFAKIEKDGLTSKKLAERFGFKHIEADIWVRRHHQDSATLRTL